MIAHRISMFGLLTAMVACAGSAQAADPNGFKLTVGPSKHDLSNVPVVVQTGFASPDVTKGVDKLVAHVTDADGKKLPAQLTLPSLLNSNAVVVKKRAMELHFIVPQIKAGQTLTYTAAFAPGDAKSPTFSWQDTADVYADLKFDGRPVLRYMYQPLGDANPQQRELTYKVYHHLYDPTGKHLVTKGPGGRYTHHRGLFYGFNRISYGDNKKADTWHCRGAHLSHAGFLGSEAGPVLGRHRVAVDWHGADKNVFAREIREMTVYNVPGGQLVEFASRLTSADGDKVILDGDPQHAGFQFRAANEVASDTAKQTYYLRPDGKGDPGKTRNWPGQKDHVDLPWNAMSFVVEGQRYTANYLDRPQNPKPARFSERDYGRFGSYFQYVLSGDKTLDLNYRIWLQEGEMSGDDVAANSAAFTATPAAKIE